MQYDTIRQIVRAAGVGSGELVLVHFWGEDNERNYANLFAAAVAAAGASPVVLQQSRAANQLLFTHADEAAFGEDYFARFDRFDTVLDLFAQRPVVLGAELPAPAMERYRRYIRTLFGKLMQCKRFVQIRLPTAANAEESGLAPEEYIRRLTAAYQIDYKQLADRCSEVILRAGAHDRVRLHTGIDCALEFTLTGRSWHPDAGDGDWPCGEVYIAPLEHATHGRVYFDRLFLADSAAQPPLEGVTLTVENGRAVSFDCAEANAWLQQLAEQDTENTVVCELGLGLNPGVTDLCGCTVLDEKADGTFHIALGANQMFGGTNHAAVHIDLVGRGQLEFC